MAETAAVQDYLKAIYQLAGDGGVASNQDLARRLGVRPASVTSMLQRLAKLDLARHERYQGVRLTAAGARGALEVIRHHRLLELYLTRMVGLSWENVHAEAEVLEHVLSETLEARLDELLGYPAFDPHGDPIPSADLSVDERTYRPLSTLEPGASGVVARVSDRDPDLLRHLADNGLVPGTSVQVDEILPFGGGVRLRRGRHRQTLAVQAAAAVFVDEVKA